MNGVQIVKYAQIQKTLSKFRAITEIYGTRKVAEKIGFSAATVSRFQVKNDAHFKTFLKVVKFVEEFERNEKKIEPSEQGRFSELFQ